MFYHWLGESMATANKHMKQTKKQRQRHSGKVVVALSSRPLDNYENFGFISDGDRKMLDDIEQSRDDLDSILGVLIAD